MRGAWMLAGGWLACTPSPPPVPMPTSTSETASAPPTPVKTVQVAVERDVACARRTDGSVWCWGDVFDGYRQTPAKVKGLPPASDVAVSDEGGCVVAEEDGSVWCWGRTRRLDGEHDLSPVPRRVAGLPPAQRVAMWQGDAGRRASEDTRERACALDREGAVWCWRGRDPAVSFGGRGGTELAVGTSEVCSLQRGAHHCAPMTFQRPTQLELIPYPRRLTTVAFAGPTRCGHFDHGALHCWGFLCGKDPPPDGCDVGAAESDVHHLGGSYDRLLVSEDEGLRDYVYRPSFGGSMREALLQPPYASGDAAGPWYACGVTVDGETRCWGWPRVGLPSFHGYAPFVRLDVPIHRRYRIPVAAPVAVGPESFCGADRNEGLRCWAPPRMSRMFGVKPRRRLTAFPLGTAHGASEAHITANNACLVLENAPARCVRRLGGSVMEWEGTSSTTMHHRTACGLFGSERELRCRIGGLTETVIEGEKGPFRGAEQVSTGTANTARPRRGGPIASTRRRVAWWSRGASRSA